MRMFFKKLRNVKCPECRGRCLVRKTAPHFKCTLCGNEFD